MRIELTSTILSEWPLHQMSTLHRLTSGKQKIRTPSLSEQGFSKASASPDAYLPGIVVESQTQNTSFAGQLRLSGHYDEKLIFDRKPSFYIWAVVKGKHGFENP